MTVTDEKEEEWKKLNEHIAKAKESKRISEAQKEFGRVLNENIGDVKGKKDKEKERLAHFVQKYSKPDGSLITEAVIVGDIPYFAVARTTEKEVNVTLEDFIKISDRTEYKPFEPEAYLNKPYKFRSTEEFDDTIEKAKGETPDSLYKKVKKIWSKYIDADNFHISICAADTMFTYFQDKIGMTHYLFFVGNNSSGKSNNLLVLNRLAYRNFTSTDMTAANIFTFLGSGEEGQGTLCEDEADGIENSNEKMAIHKNGYITGFPVSRIDTSFGRKQLKYNTFCFKAFAAERFPDSFKAKGFNQRVLEIQCYYGDPDEDIAEVTNSAGDERLQSLSDELEETRNLLLAYRLLHFNIEIPDIKLNIKGREKQLFKPVIRVFQNTETLMELLPVISNYVTQKREANDATFNAYLYRTIRDMIKEQSHTVLSSTKIWDRIVSDLEATVISGRNLSADTTEFGVISQKEIIQTLEHVFGAKKKRTNTGRYLVFNTVKLDQLGKVYDLSIWVEIVKEGTNPNPNPNTKSVTGVTGVTDIGTDKEEDYTFKGLGDKGIERENMEFGGKDSTNNEGMHTYNPSHVSHTSLSEEQKAEARAKYDATRARIRRK
ncbi:MAG TPA: hypothetical protein VFS97_13550 [Nitrososphaeraceae archaeon]|nr:hypothetical protein [Nitrososphaeraceae archaeon]